VEVTVGIVLATRDFSTQVALLLISSSTLGLGSFSGNKTGNKTLWQPVSEIWGCLGHFTGGVPVLVAADVLAVQFLQSACWGTKILVDLHLEG
jgi:hypothetical protein